MCVTETWLDVNWSNNCILSNVNYSILCCDRDRHGGGTAIIFNNTIVHLKDSTVSNTNQFNIIKGIFVASTVQFCLICCYLPPTTSSLQTDRERMDTFIKTLSSMLSPYSTNIIVMIST